MRSARSPAFSSTRPFCRVVVAFAVALVACGPRVALGQELLLRDAGVVVTRDLQVELQSLAALARTMRQPALSVSQAPATDRLIAAIDRIRAADLLLDDHHRDLDERLQRQGASAAVLQRHRENGRLLRERLDRLYRAAAPLTPPPNGAVVTAADVRTAVDGIVEALADATDQSARMPIGVTLPYRSLALPQTPPAFGATITPAYLASPLPAPQAADLADTPDTPFTSALRGKADALAQDPIAIFEFVQNEVRSEFYYGAMKDATETLRQLSGNDTDQASLLVALLRASRIPARYVRGVIGLTGPQALSWTGAGSTRRAAEIFTRAGIPFRPILQGGTIGAFEIEHTWVEAYVAYSNYRGVRLGSIGQAWIPLDPSFKAIEVTAGEDLLGAMGLSADTLVPEYLSEPQALSPMEFYRRKITDYLAQNRPDLTFEQVLSTRSTRPVRSGLLPSTLPYAVVSANEESPALAESLRHRVRFVAEGEGGVSFDITVSAAELAGRRLTLSYVPATVDDQVVAHAFLGLDNTPAYLVKLRPVLKIGGVVKAGGATPVQTGAMHAFTVEIQTPRSVVPIVNSVLAGGYYAVGLASQPAPYESPLTRAPDDTEHPAADRLYSLAIDYTSRWNEAERTLERILRVVNVRPALSHVMVGTVHARTLLFGQPQSIEWRGVFVDADLRVAEPVPTGNDDARAREFMRLSGLAGSALEADVLQLNLQVDAVSAANLIQLARAGGVPVEEVDATNLAAVMARLQTAPVVSSEIADAVNQGWRVTVPRRDLTRNIWTGIGYVMVDPATGAGGYFISGGLAGGMSVLPPEDWPDQPIAEELGSPNAEPPNTDPSSVRWLTKVSNTDKQNGPVDRPLQRPLSVWARDEDGRPVKNATVTFVAQFGGGRFEDTDTFTATTNYLGIATAPFTLGRSTSSLPFFVRASPADAQLTQVGQNIVTASVGGSEGPVFLPAPFQHFAYPGPPVRIVKVLGDQSGPPGTLGTLEPGLFGGSLLARVEDAFENPVSNTPVRFTVLAPQPIIPAMPAGAFPPQGAINLTLYPHEPECPIATPVLGDCGAVGQLSATTSATGAGVNTILGNTVGTVFQVEASIPTESQVPPQTFQLLSRTARGFGNGLYYSPELLITLPTLVSDRGDPINAAPAGSALPRPLEALLMLREDDYVIEPIGLPCPEPTDVCYRVRSLETSRVRPIDVNGTGVLTFRGAGTAVVTADRSLETASVQFTPAVGVEAATTPPVNTTAGRYASTLTTALAPALNTIHVTAAASVWVPCFNLHTGTVTPTQAHLAAGQNAWADSMFFPRVSDLVDSCVASNSVAATGTAQTLSHFVFGVRPTVSDVSVPVSVEGLTLGNIPIGYQIQPPEYVSSVADVDLFEVEPDGDVWKGALTGTTRSSAGDGVLLQGTGFDLTKTYQSQLVLNRGTPVEIRSPKAALTLLNPVDLTLDALDRAVVKTYLDRTNHTSCEAPGALVFVLSDDASVTIRVNGGVLTTSGATGPVTWASVTLPAGEHSVPVRTDAVSLPGAHMFVIEAAFTQPGGPAVVRTAVGSIQHDVIIQSHLSVGHTLIQDVDLFAGHLTLSRDDVSIPGHGPALQFTRSYASAGHRSSGPMGAGWSHSFDAHVVKDPCGTLTLVGGEGSGVKFSEPTPGTDAQGHAIETYRPQAGYHGRLVLNVADESYDFFTKQRVRYHYEKDFTANEGSAHRLAFIGDSDENRLTLTYEPQAPFNLRTVTDASGRTLTFTYQPFGLVAENRLTRLEGPLGLVVTYEYDQFGNLTRASRDVRVERYDYTTGNPQDRHNLTRAIGPNNGATGPDADITEVAYFTEQDTIPGWVDDPRLFAEKPELVKSITEGAGTLQASAHHFSYDFSAPAIGFVTTVVDPRQVPTAYTVHSTFGAVLEKRIVLPDGDNVTTTRWAFQDGVNDVFVTRVTDANGRVTSYTYDPNGNLQTETISVSALPYAPVVDAAGAAVEYVTKSFQYDAGFGRLTRQVDAAGRVILHEISPANGRTLAVTTNPLDGTAPVVTRYAYVDTATLKGLLQTLTDPRGRVTSYETHDQFGNATRIVDPEGNTTTNVYDARGRLLESQDTFGHRTRYEYDPLDRLVAVTRSTWSQPADLAMASPADRQTQTAYFPGGQPRTTTTGTGHVTEFEYDALNRQVVRRESVQDADGASLTLQVAAVWDGNGNKIRETDRRGTLHETAFDLLNRPTDTRVGGQVVATLTYDAAGNRVTQTDLHGHTTRTEYDGLYRPVRTVLPLPPYATSVGYDLSGNVLSETDANGHTITRTYDGLDRLTRTTNPLGMVMRFEYDAAGNRLIEENEASGLRTSYEDYDGRNRPRRVRQTFTDPVTGQPVVYSTLYTYLDAENVKLTTDPRGVVTRERFNGHDALIERVQDAGGLQLLSSYRYDGNGNLTSEKDSEGAVVDAAFAYDGLNRRIAAAYPLGGQEQWFYDGNGNVIRTVDRRGIERTAAFDHLDRRVRETLIESISNAGAELVVSAVAYDDTDSSSALTDANGNSTRQEQDALHRTVRVVDALNNETLAEWDGRNRVAVETAQTRTEFTYDALDRLVQTRQLTGDGPFVKTTGYQDALNRRVDTDPRRESDPDAAETVVQFDPLQRARRTSRRHSGLAARYGATEVVLSDTSYDGQGNVTQTTDANGHVTLMQYDGAGRRVRVTQGSGTAAADTVFTFDRAGNLLTTKDGRAHGGQFDRRYTYDVRNRKVLDENGAGGVKTYTYDQGGNLISVTEPKGGVHRTVYAYDELSQLLSVDETRGGAGGITRYRYDPNRNRVGQQDASGRLTTYRYDALNRQTDSFQHTSAGADESTARHWHFEYDTRGNQTLLVDAEGQLVAKRYDQFGRLILKEYGNHQPGADGGIPLPQLLSIAYTYDAKGHERRIDETKRTAAGIIVETGLMEYDPLDRLVSKTNYDGKAVRFEYDRAGNQTAVVDADGERTDYAFDSRGRLVTATEGSATTRYEYWPDDLKRATTYPNGVVSEMSYDDADRLRQIVNHAGDAGSPISQFDYTYDANGNRLTQVERHARLNGGAAQATNYQYDAANRLTGVDYPGAAGLTYGYAANGNRVSESGVAPFTDSAVARTYAYNGLNQLTTIADAANPDASVALQYDLNGNTTAQKIGVIDPATGDVPAPTSVKSYDWNIRDALAKADGDSGPVTFDYDYGGRRVKMITPVFQLRYLYDKADVLQEYDGASLLTTQRYSYGATGLFSMNAAGSGKTFYLLDGLGSTSELTDGTGATRASYSYDVWGKAVQSFDTTANRRRFTGHYSDTETGLQYFGARHYDESTGRFLSRDTYGGDVWNPVSQHPYLYANANPTVFGDPTGFASVPCNEKIFLSCTRRSLMGFFKGAGEAAGTVVYEALATTYDLEQVIGHTLKGLATGNVEAIEWTSALGRHIEAENLGTLDSLNMIATNAVKAPVEVPLEYGRAIASGDPERIGRATLNFETFLYGFKSAKGGAARGAVVEEASTVAARKLTPETMLREADTQFGIRRGLQEITEGLQQQEVAAVRRQASRPGPHQGPPPRPSSGLSAQALIEEAEIDLAVQQMSERFSPRPRTPAPRPPELFVLFDKDPNLIRPTQALASRAGGDAILNISSALKRKLMSDRFVNVVAHGAENGTVTELAVGGHVYGRALRQVVDAPGVNMITCQGALCAADVAAGLGVPVRASPHVLGIHPETGQMWEMVRAPRDPAGPIVRIPRETDPNSWQTFYPPKPGK